MSKRQELREKRHQQELIQRIGIIVAFVVIALIVVGWVVLSQQPVQGIVQVTPMPHPQANANAMGDPKAPVKLIEYADFQCPYCKQFTDDTEAQIIATYVQTGKVYFEYHSMGTFIGPESERAAEAAYCAGDQGKFWEMHDIIFANQGVERSGALGDSHLTAFAAKIGLDSNQFSSCFTGGKYAGKVSQDLADGTAAGVQSTPSFLLNGTLVEGALSFTDFQTKIDAALAAAGK